MLIKVNVRGVIITYTALSTSFHEHRDMKGLVNDLSMGGLQKTNVINRVKQILCREVSETALY